MLLEREDFSRKDIRRSGLQRQKDFSNRLAGTLLVESDSIIVLGKTVVLRIETIFLLSYFQLIY